jgi:DNA-binding transcriptional regulator LsrR (DeoR family)
MSANFWHNGLERSAPDDRAPDRKRKDRYAEICADTYARWIAGATQAVLAEKYGVRRRQIAARLEKHRIANNLPNGRREAP